MFIICPYLVYSQFLVLTLSKTKLQPWSLYADTPLNNRNESKPESIVTTARRRVDEVGCFSVIHIAYRTAGAEPQLDIIFIH